MMKKKVVIIGPAYPYRGGQALVEAHLYDTLTGLGYDCQTISFTLLYPKIFFPGTTQFDESSEVFFSHQDKIERIINSINPWTWWKAAKRIKALKPDLCIFVWWMPFFGPAYSFMAYLAKKMANAKVLFLVENYISHEARWFDRLWSKITLDLADSFICQSEYIRGEIEQNHQGKPIFKTTLSVFDCYDLGRYNQEQAREKLGIKSEQVILFFGLIRRYKGLDKLIEAFPKLQEAYRNATLLIVGECYEDIAYYEQLIEEHQIAAQTILVNQFIANENIEPYFKAANVVCLPYNSASQSGILMMAYGFLRPVVVTNVGGLPELVVEGKTGTVIPDNTPATIAAGVVRALEANTLATYEANIKGVNQHLGYINLAGIMQEAIEVAP